MSCGYFASLLPRLACCWLNIESTYKLPDYPAFHFLFRERGKCQTGLPSQKTIHNLLVKGKERKATNLINGPPIHSVCCHASNTRRPVVQVQFHLSRRLSIWLLDGKGGQFGMVFIRVQFYEMEGCTLRRSHNRSDWVSAINSYLCFIAFNVNFRRVFVTKSLLLVPVSIHSIIGRFCYHARKSEGNR